MKSQIAAIHQIHNDIPEKLSVTAGAQHSAKQSFSDVQVLDILETVSQIAQERVIELLEHASLSDDIPDTFRSDNYTKRGSVRQLSIPRQSGW